ncbi:MAG: patatin-like phospholipase family protein [Nitriliruptoraceae bacterium]
MSARAPTTALVLSGGGARGAFEAGVAQALEAKGIRPTVLSGTSAGGITGAALACGWSAARITELWCSLQSRHVMRPRKDLHRLIAPSGLILDPRELIGGRPTWVDGLLHLFGWTWLFQLGPLRALLVEELGGEALPIESDRTLVLSAVEVDTGQPVRFANRPSISVRGRDPAETIITDLTVDHLLASSAIPGLFQPIEIDGREFWDGVLSQNTPVTGALAHDPDRMLVVGTVPADPPSRPPKNLGDVISLAIAHVLRDAVVQDVRTAAHADDQVDGDGDGGDHLVEMLTVLPDTPIVGLGDLLDFEPQLARVLVDSGRSLTDAALERRGWSA